MSLDRFCMTTWLLAPALIFAVWLPSGAADLEMQVVDKNCWIEIFEDDDFDADDFFSLEDSPSPQPDADPASSAAAASSSGQ